MFHSVLNTKPVSISPALLYLSNPWFASINDIGEVSDVIVIPGKFPSQSIFQKLILIWVGHVHVDPKPVLAQSKVVDHFENFGEEFTVDFKFTLTKDFPLKWMNVLTLGKGNFWYKIISFSLLTSFFKSSIWGDAIHLDDQKATPINLCKYQWKQKLEVLLPTSNWQHKSRISCSCNPRILC